VVRLSGPVPRWLTRSPRGLSKLAALAPPILPCTGGVSRSKFRAASSPCVATSRPNCSNGSHGTAFHANLIDASLVQETPAREASKRKPEEKFRLAMSVGVPRPLTNVSDRNLRDTCASTGGGPRFGDGPSRHRLSRRLALQRRPSSAASQRHFALPTSRSAGFGVIDHIAFGSRGFDAIKQHLTRKACRSASTKCEQVAPTDFSLPILNNVLMSCQLRLAKERLARWFFPSRRCPASRPISERLLSPLLGDDSGAARNARPRAPPRASSYPGERRLVVAIGC